MHVLRECKIDFDYLIGAQVEGFETMVGLDNKSKIAVFQGDEYLASVLDKKPKFLIYKPSIAIISGISWDHINVFSSFQGYVQQFRKFIDCIQKEGKLIYCN